MEESKLLTVGFAVTGVLVAAYLPAILALYWLVKVQGGEENEARLQREREISGLFGEREMRHWNGRGHLWTVIFAMAVTVFAFLLAYPALAALMPAGGGGEPTTLQALSATLFFAFLGAYIFAVQTTARRFHAGDLNPDIYIQITTRMILALIVAAVFSLILPRVNLAGDANLVLATYISAFVIGIFPENGLDWILSSFSRMVRTGTSWRREDRLLQGNSYDLRALKGLNYWHAVRLNVEGIDNVHNLAHAELPHLIRRTRFSVQQVIDWVDQAVLLIHLRNIKEFEALHDHGVHGLSDFQAVYRNADGRKTLERTLVGDGEDGALRVNLLYTTLQQAPSGDALRLFWRYKSSYLTGAFESFSRGKVFADLERYEEAIEQFNLSLEQNPLRPEIMVNRGRVYRQLARRRQLEGSAEGAEEEFRQALSDFSRAEKLDPFYLPAYLERAQTYLQQEEFDRAEKAFQEALLLNRNNPEALVGHALALQRQARALQQAGKGEEAHEKLLLAVSECEEARGIEQGFVGAGVRLAAIYREMREYGKARTELEKVLSLAPQSGELFLERAELNVVETPRRYAAAHADFEQALRHGVPRPGDVYTRWGEMYLEMGDLVRAIAVLRLAITENPTRVTPFRLRASAYQGAGRLTRAIEDYTHIVENLDPDAADVYVDRGTAYKKLGQYELALEDYNRGLQLNPNLPLAYANRGQLYQDRGQHHRALSDFQEAVRVQERLLEEAPDTFQPSAVPYNHLGTALVRIKDWENAYEQFTKAISADPRSGEALNNLGLAQEQQGKLALALSQFTTAIRIEEGNPVYYYNRGRLYLNQGEIDKALSDLERALALDGKYAVAYALRARAYEQNGQFVAAADSARRALEIEPENEIARQVVARLAQAEGVPDPVTP